MKTIVLMSAGCAAVLLAGCARMQSMMPDSGPSASATLAPTAGNSVSGSVRFLQQGEQVRVTGEVRGLRPNTEHGFHVHEKGDCSAPDASSAGGHFNPGSMAHGRYDTPPHHAGDLPSLRADASGVARIDYSTGAFRVGSGSNDVVGRGLVVHRDPDDYRSQPAGNSGPRLACAVIARS